MKNVPITHLFGLDSFELKHYANILAEFADNGAKYISLSSGILKKLCYEPAFCCQLYSIFQMAAKSIRWNGRHYAFSESTW